jgi:hypothetical protein
MFKLPQKKNAPKSSLAKDRIDPSCNGSTRAPPANGCALSRNALSHDDLLNDASENKFIKYNEFYQFQNL